MDDGRKLVERLDASGYPPDVAMWFFYSDVGQWKLLLGSGELDTLGPSSSYKVIADALASLAEPSLPISDIKVVRSTEPLVNAMRVMVGTGPAPAISVIKMSNNYINGIFLQDAVLYRMAPPKK